jgi:autotransporter translocation and assembly factor TamB
VRRPRLRSVGAIVGKSLVYLIAVILVLVVAGIGVLETGWAKNEIRALIVRQANEYLTATLEIGRLDGSLLRGLRLGNIRLSRNDQPIVTIDEIDLSYSLRELWQNGTVIRRIRLTRPRVVGAKLADGRWNLGALVKRETEQEQRSGPGRPIEILSIEVVDGAVRLDDPLQFGAANVPTDFEHLDATLAYTYHPVNWTLQFTSAAFVGRAPDLTVTKLSGGIGNGAGGWHFDNLFVQTPTTTFTMDGRVLKSDKPAVLDLRVRAPRFAFQEWAGILHGLKHIAVDASFDTRLQGPLASLGTDLQLQGTGGSVNGRLVLDTTIPGWHGAGTLTVGRIDLARWLDRPDKPSDISGRVTFDLDLDLGRHFPRGTYAFDGPHAAFAGYAGDHVRARGQLTATEVQIAQATAVAYGANVTAGAGSAIGLDAPFPFRFQGAVSGIDLRRVPAQVPVPHVESALTFTYDVTGRFTEPYIIGRAQFSPSGFLGASIGAGTVGAIDTRATPLTFAGEGDVNGVSLHRFGRDLDINWMQAPRYAGTVSGHFHVDGAGTDRQTLALTGGGRLTRAQMFHGTLADADVGIEIAGGALTASYNGRFARIDPSVAMDDPRLAAALTGSANVQTTVRDLLTGTPALADYDIAGTAALGASVVRGVPIDHAAFRGSLRDAVLRVAQSDLQGPAVAGHVTGVVAFGQSEATALDYELTRLDLARIDPRTRGSVATKGRLSGPYAALRFAGDATVSDLSAPGIDALALNGHYDVTLPSGSLAQASARITARASFPAIFGQALEQVSGSVTMAGERIGFDVQLAAAQGRRGGVKGDILLHADRHQAELSALTLTFGSAPWQLSRGAALPAIAWTDRGVDVQPLVFLEGTARDQRIEIAGTWRADGSGALHVTGTHVRLETFAGAFAQPAHYSGLLELEGTLRGTRAAPIVSAGLTITNGRVQRVPYQQLASRVDYSGGMFTVAARLDQARGVWITADGTLPLGVFRRALPERPIDIVVKSSPIDLGIIEGLTNVVRNVTGTMQLDLTAVGTSRDPHARGTVEISGAGFLATASGSRYKNVRASLQFAPDRITVSALHAEDSGGDPLDVHGSLGTHELKVGDLEIDADARHFEVIRNEYGKIDIDAKLQLRGRFESPRLGGDLTISSGELKVDQILERALFQPYSTQAAAPPEVDAVAALNPWERFALGIALHVPDTLKLTGDNVQVATGTPIGLGNINLKVAGDLYLFKDAGEALSVTGSFDSVSGRYSFQGRQFDVDPTSSINFRGDLNPELDVAVTQTIGAVVARVSLTGPMREPELHLTSTPPLDSSDILSMIVFGTPANELSASQQQNLAVRAGTLAAGFLAAPIVSALQTELGLDILQLQTSGEFETGPRITVGNEIAPGLVARFSRQFGTDPYDELTLEYSLTRLFRLRATFSDAQSLNALSPFRRLERAGIDLLLFFSF